MMNMIRSVWWVGVGGVGVWEGREEGCVWEGRRGVCVWKGEGGGSVCGRGGGGRCKKCLTGIFTDWVRERV